MDQSSAIFRVSAGSYLRWNISGLCALLLVCGCSANPMAMDILKDVKPLGIIEISQICIKLNSSDEKEFADDLFRVVQKLGFKTMAKQAAFSGECQFSLTYDVSWTGYVPKWPLIMNVTVYDGRSQIGYVRYDASRGSGRPDKYGSAIGKLEPLLTELFANVRRTTTGT